MQAEIEVELVLVKLLSVQEFGRHEIDPVRILKRLERRLKAKYERKSKFNET